MIRRKSIFIVLLALVIILSTTACQKELNRYETEFYVFFDTVTKVISFQEEEQVFTDQSEQIYEKMQRFHQLFDSFQSYPDIVNIYTLNQQAAKKPVKVDPILFDFLLYGKMIYEKTNGKVNIALGSVLQIWHQYREMGIDQPKLATLPRKEKLQEASMHTDINQLILDEKNMTVYYQDPNLQLDVGAIAKGYAVQQVMEQLEQIGFDNIIISAGGNVTTKGFKPGQSKWAVGIQNPNKDQSNSIIDTLYLSGESLVSSGDYERYYEVDGKQYHHIIDPDTLYPANYFQQVSIVSKDSALADALSTAVFLMPLEVGQVYIESLDGIEAVWVLPNDEIVTSSGIAVYRKKD